MTRRTSTLALLASVAAIGGGMALSRTGTATLPELGELVTVQTDSLRAETRRQGTSGTLAPRVTVVRRLADRIDSLLAAAASAPPVDTASPPPPDTAVPPPSDSGLTPPPTPPPAPPTGAMSPPLPALVTVAGIDPPRRFVTWPQGLADLPCTDTVRANPQGALNAARGGQRLCLDGSFTAALTLPARASAADTGWIVVRSLRAVVPHGRRASLADTIGMAQLVAPSSTPAIAALPGARRWILANLHVGSSPAHTGPVYNVVDERWGSSEIILDRVVIRPEWAHGVQRCVTFNNAFGAVVYSHLTHCKYSGFDSQAIGGWNGTGPFLVFDNTLEGGAENVMFGGADPSVAGNTACDVIVARNWIHKPIGWRGKVAAKNLFETKNVCRFVVQQNVLENSWSEGQTGGGFVIKTSNQGGKCRWCSVHDGVVAQNLILRASEPFAVTGASNTAMIGALDSLTRRIAIVDNYADSSAHWEASPGNFRFVFLANQPRDVTLRGNTFAAERPLKHALSGASAGLTTAVRLTVHDNTWTPTTYHLFGCGGVVTPWNSCVQGFDYRNNVLVGAPKAGVTYPTGFGFAPTLGLALASAGITRARIDSLVAGVRR